MILNTEHLHIRDYVAKDWVSVHEYGSIPNFTQFEMWGPNSVDDSKRFIADSITKSLLKPRFHFELAVCLKDQNRQIGGCGIRRDTESSSVANLGWAMNPLFQNNGFTTEAAAALIEFGFQTLGLSVIYATCDTRNIASFRVMEKIGMKRVGHMIGDRKIEDQILDSFRYEILPARDKPTS